MTFISLVLQLQVQGINQVDLWPDAVGEEQEEESLRWVIVSKFININDVILIQFAWAGNSKVRTGTWW